MRHSIKSISNPGNGGGLLWDVSGAFGDIGVLIPLAIALISRNGINPTALFLMAGLFYILSSYYFRITMPVQPLKAMSAIAISTGVSCAVLNGAGLTMGIILLIITLTGASTMLGNLFPTSVIRGIQMGLGLMLVRASWGMIHTNIVAALLAVAIAGASLLLFRKIPPLILLLLIGVCLSLKSAHLSAMGPVPIMPVLPDINTLSRGFTLLVLPQIALTFGNAVVATEATGKLLYGERAERLNLTSIPASMGLANILSGIMGGAPMCHGCGGLTAHRSFGATSERSGYIIGFTLITIALLLGRSALSVISAFPPALLGVLLCYVGVQHALFIKDILGDRKAIMVASTVALSAMITGNLTIGFLAGLGIHYGFILMKNAIRA
jgi:SulP family sulfate permease